MLLQAYTIEKCNKTVSMQTLFYYKVRISTTATNKILVTLRKRLSID